MKNGSKVVIELDDLYQDKSFFSYIIKNKYYSYFQKNDYCEYYSGIKPNIADIKFTCNSIGQFLEILNGEMQKAHFNEKFDEFINEKD